MSWLTVDLLDNQMLAVQELWQVNQNQQLKTSQSSFSVLYHYDSKKKQIKNKQCEDCYNEFS